MFKFRTKKCATVLSAVEAGLYRHGNDDLIELRSVIKAYQTAAGDFTALRGVNLQIDRGEFVAVVGKSGSGKSTLINMITGIDRPSSGAVLVGDTAVHTLSEGQMAVWRGKHVGVIFQFFQLLPTLTILENVMLPMDFCNSYPLRQRPERAMALLDEVDMVEGQHTGEMKKRGSIGDRPEQVDAGLGRPTRLSSEPASHGPGCFAKTGPSKWLVQMEKAGTPCSRRCVKPNSESIITNGRR